MRYEIRALETGELLDTGFRLLTQRFWLLVGLQICASVPAFCVLFGIELLSPSVSSGTGGADAPPFSPALVVLVAAGVLALIVFQFVVMASITQVLAALYRGESTGFVGALREGLRVAPRLIGTWLLIGLLFGVVGVVVGGVFFAVVAAAGSTGPLVILLAVIAGIGFLILSIYFGFPLVLLAPIAVLERTFFLSALSRCLDLMKSHRLSVFAVYMVLGLASLVFQIPSAILQTVPSLVWVGISVQLVVQIVLGAYGGALAVLIYFNLRCRKEGYDLEQLTAAVEGHTAAP